MRLKSVLIVMLVALCFLSCSDNYPGNHFAGRDYSHMKKGVFVVMK